MFVVDVAELVGEMLETGTLDVDDDEGAPPIVLLLVLLLVVLVALEVVVVVVVVKDPDDLLLSLVRVEPVTGVGRALAGVTTVWRDDFVVGDGGGGG